MSGEKKTKTTLQVSKAPPPITPIRGTGSATPRATVKAPEWSALVQQDEEAKQNPSYKAEYDRVRSLYDERDALLALPFKGEKTIKRLGEISDELFKTENPQYSAPESIEPIQAKPETPATFSVEPEIRKRAALIKEVESFWPKIERDLRDASRKTSGLAKVAKHTINTYWKVQEALNWAKQRGKIEKDKAQLFVSGNPESVLSPMLRSLLKLD